MPATEIRFSEFLELLLARLYEMDRQHGPRYFDLNRVTHELKASVPPSWVFDAAKVLERNGLARCIFTFGATHAELTGEGRLFVEREDGTTGVIREYHKNPGHYVVVTGSGNQVTVGGEGQSVAQAMTVEQERAPAFDLVDRLEDELKAEKTLGELEKQDLLADLDMVRQQLKKREPNRGALAALLQPLSQIASIAGTVASLIRLINQ